MQESTANRNSDQVLTNWKPSLDKFWYLKWKLQFLPFQDSIVFYFPFSMQLFHTRFWLDDGLFEVPTNPSHTFTVFNFDLLLEFFVGDIYEMMLPIANIGGKRCWWQNNQIFHQKLKVYIEVGDGCRRRNVLMNISRCWWQLWSFGHQHLLSLYISFGYLHSEDVTKIEILSPTSNCHQF